MNELKTPEITFDRQRITSDSSLIFSDTGDKHAFVANPNALFGTNDFSFMWFFESTQVGDDNFAQFIGDTPFKRITLRHTNRLLRATFDPDATLAKDLIGNTIVYQNDSKVCAVVQRRGNNAEIWQNGTLIYEEIDFFDPGDAFSVGTSLFLGARDTLFQTLNGNMNHFCWFDKALSNEEINWFYFRGEILESSHANILAHYGLTERYAFKPDAVTDAAFIAKHANINANDLVMFDLVEQYNYDKVSPIQATHAVLQNYTDDEVGAGANASLQTAKVDFYPPKRTLIATGLYNRVTDNLNPDWNNRLNRVQKTGFDTSLPSDSSFTVLVDFNYLSQIDLSMVFFSLGNLNTTGIEFYIQTQTLRFREAGVTTSFGGVGIVGPSSGRALAAISYDNATNTYLFKLNISDNITEVSHVGAGWAYDADTDFRIGFLKGVGNTAGVIWNQALVFDTIAPENELRDWVSGNLAYSGNPILDWRFNFKQGQVSDGMTIIDQSTNGNDGTLAFNFDGYEYIRDRTLLPEIFQGFELSDNSMELTSFPGSSNGYTFLFDIIFPNSTLTIDQEWLRINGFGNPNFVIRNASANDIIRVDVTNPNLRSYSPVVPNGIQGIYNQIAQFSVSSDGASNIDPDQLLRYNGNYQDLAASGAEEPLPDLGGLGAVFFARDTTPTFDLEATILRIRVYDRVLTKKELDILFNNSLLSNLVKGAVLDYQFNEGSFYENGVNVLVSNLGSGGSIYDGIFRGLTGATPADQLADVPNHIKTLQTLR